MGFRGAKRFNCFSHGADVRWRRAAAAAEHPHPECSCFPREERKIFGRRFRINDAVAFALGKSGVGHAADAKAVNGGKLLQNRKKRLRAKRAIRADHLDVFAFQLRRGIGGADIAVRCAFFRVCELRHDGQAGKRANGFDGEEQFFDIGKRFEDIDLDLFRSGMARLHAEAQRPDRARYQDFPRRGFARFAGDFHAAAVEPLHFFAEAERRELEAIRPKRVGLDDLCARFDVRLVDTEYRFRLGRVQLIKTALRR